MDKDEKDPRQEELREAYAKWLNVTRQELSEALRKSLRNAEDTKELREAYAKWRKVTRQELGKALHKAYEHVEDTDELVEAYLRRCSATDPVLHEALWQAFKNMKDTEEIREAYAKWRNDTEAVLHEALRRAFKIQNPGVVEDYIKRRDEAEDKRLSKVLLAALRDDDLVVRKAAFQHPNATDEVLRRALNF